MKSSPTSPTLIALTWSAPNGRSGRFTMASVCPHSRNCALPPDAGSVFPPHWWASTRGTHRCSRDALRMFVLERMQELHVHLGPRDVVTVRLASGSEGAVMNLEPIREDASP